MWNSYNIFCTSPATVRWVYRHFRPAVGESLHKDILVTGGDGFGGRHLCSELLDSGHHVTSLSRMPDPTVLPNEVDLQQGDVTDYDTIEDAFDGKLPAVPSVPSSPRSGALYCR
ncbi:SDR family oxidoreductase [Halobacteriales archaeon Cl-PHB]